MVVTRQMSELEEELKFYKGKETVRAKDFKLGLEAQLKELREQQRQARPLPARLQAATDRVAKTHQSCEESEEKVKAACEVLKAARKEHDENLEKNRAARQELEEVKKAAGAGPVAEAEKGLAAGMLAAMAARNIVGADAEAFMADVLQFHLRLTSGGGGASSTQGQPAGGTSPSASLPCTARPLPLRVPPVGHPGRGRSLPREVPVPRDGSTSRSPRGDHQEAC